MAKRFTDSEKFKKHFIRSLPSKYKLFWFYILDDCSNAGIWEVDMEVACLRIGEILDKTEALNLFNKDEKRVYEFDGGKKWFIPSFVSFQYGDDFNPKNRLHESVKATLVRLGLFSLIPVRGPLNGGLEAPKDKEKDKDKDRDKKEGVQGEGTVVPFFDLFWKAYPARNGKKLEKQETYREFLKISVTEHNLVVKAAVNYANSGWIAKDPKRFLRDGFWREWLEPAISDTPLAPKKALPSGTYLTKAQQHNMEALKRFNEKHADRDDKQGNTPTFSLLPGPEV